jgi:hypothetical protein
VELLSSKLMQLKLQRKIDKLKDSKSRQFLPLHQMKRPMIHLKKKSMTKGERREIRDLIILLLLTMIICLPLMPSPWYPLVKPPSVSMGQTIPNGDTNHVSYASNANAFYISHMSYHEFDASYVLMRNKFGRVVALYVGPHHKRSNTYVWVPKCLITNLNCFVGLLLR